MPVFASRKCGVLCVGIICNDPGIRPLENDAPAGKVLSVQIKHHCPFPADLFFAPAQSLRQIPGLKQLFLPSPPLGLCKKQMPGLKKSGRASLYRDSGGIRTPNQQNRNLSFYPVELRSRKFRGKDSNLWRISRVLHNKQTQTELTGCDKRINLY